ncbi:hypothetical protein LSAT2_011512 [Lamellibrachia satsuma]|nr:hypothetical protein LSAT2_011512 [Lamellibrachia satsuma]
MIRFYRAIIENIIIFSIVVWFGRAGQKEKQQLEAIVKGASRIIGSELPSIEYIYQARCAQKSRALHGIQPTQPAISLSIFPLSDDVQEATRVECSTKLGQQKRRHESSDDDPPGGCDSDNTGHQTCRCRVVHNEQLFDVRQRAVAVWSVYAWRSTERRQQVVSGLSCQLPPVHRRWRRDQVCPVLRRIHDRRGWRLHGLPQRLQDLRERRRDNQVYRMLPSTAVGVTTSCRPRQHVYRVEATVKHVLRRKTKRQCAPSVSTTCSPHCDVCRYSGDSKECPKCSGRYELDDDAKEMSVLVSTTALATTRRTENAQRAPTIASAAAVILNVLSVKTQVLLERRLL